MPLCHRWSHPLSSHGQANGFFLAFLFLVIMLTPNTTDRFTLTRNIFNPIYHESYPFLSESEVAQSCPTLCDPVYCSLPGSSVHGILQARILKWVTISFSIAFLNSCLKLIHSFNKHLWSTSYLPVDTAVTVISHFMEPTIQHRRREEEQGGNGKWINEEACQTMSKGHKSWAAK